MKLLADVQKSVEASYVNGKPRHHLESARSTMYDPKDPTMSSIFVVDAETFQKMDGETIREVFRRRHILVTGVETEDMDFDLEGLSTMGSLIRTRQMQGEYMILHLDKI
jgi:hypothetical protein